MDPRRGVRGWGLRAAGSVSSFSKNLRSNEAGRFHHWAETEQQNRFPTAPTPKAETLDLFGRSVPDRAPARPRSNSSGSRRYCVGELATGISERDASAGVEAKPFRGLNQGRPALLRHFHEADTGKEAEPASKDTCRFHAPPPAERRRAESEEVPSSRAGLRSGGRESRWHGDRHGRAATPEWHGRYGASALGTSLPAAVRCEEPPRPATAEEEPQQEAQGSRVPACGRLWFADDLRGRVSTPRLRRDGLCDPSRITQAPALGAHDMNRFHVPPEDASGTVRHFHQIDSVRSSAVEAWQHTALRWQGSLSNTKRTGPDVQSNPPAPNPASPRYMLGRADKVPARGSPRAPPPAPSPRSLDPVVQISAGGAVMISKRHVSEREVPAARRSSSPLS